MEQTKQMNIFDFIPDPDAPIEMPDFDKTIFDRKRPLAEATQRRIAFGIKKYILDAEKPYVVKNKDAMAFMIQYHGETRDGDSRGQLLTEPIKTIDTSNRYGLVTAFITKFYKTGVGQGLNEPLHTITTSPGHFGVVSAFITRYYGGEHHALDMSHPIGTITTKDRFGVVSAFLIKYYGQGCGQTLDSPLGTITTKDRFGLVTVEIGGEQYLIKDIFLRMLKPEELKLLQGFPEDYIIDHDFEWKPYPVKEQVARIGNSVVPIMAEQIVRANCNYLKIGERQPNLILKPQANGQMAFAI